MALKTLSALPVFADSLLPIALIVLTVFSAS